MDIARAQENVKHRPQKTRYRRRNGMQGMDGRSIIWQNTMTTRVNLQEREGQLDRYRVRHMSLWPTVGIVMTVCTQGDDARQWQVPCSCHLPHVTGSDNRSFFFEYRREIEGQHDKIQEKNEKRGQPKGAPICGREGKHISLSDEIHLCSHYHYQMWTPAAAPCQLEKAWAICRRRSFSSTRTARVLRFLPPLLLIVSPSLGPLTAPAFFITDVSWSSVVPSISALARCSYAYCCHCLPNSEHDRSFSIRLPHTSYHLCAQCSPGS